MRPLIRFSFFLLLLAFFLVSCEKDTPILPVEPDPVLNPDRLNFQNPVVGQFNTFEAFSYECGAAFPTESWELRLEITAVTEEAIELTESYNNGSPEVLTALREEGVLRISPEDRQRSQLFFFYGSDSLRLDAPPVRDLTYRDCVFYHGNEKFTGDIVARINELELAGRTFKQQKVVSCVPVILDLDAYLFYDKYGLTASITTSSSEFGGNETTHTNMFVLKEE